MGLSATLMLDGCGRGKPAGQVLAHVGNEDITTAQLSTVLGGSGDGQRAPANATALRNLIDQTLLMNAAVDSHLDRKPDFLRQLGLVKRGLLASAYARTIAQAAADFTPSGSDVDAFYNAHPELFARRRVLVVTEIGVDDSGLSAPAKGIVSGGSDPDAVSRDLAGQSVYIQPTVRVISPEQMNGTARQLLSAQPGDKYRYRMGSTLVLGRVDEARSMPLSLPAARDAIVDQLRQAQVEGRIKTILQSLHQEQGVTLSSLARTILSGRPTPAS